MAFDKSFRTAVPPERGQNMQSPNAMVMRVMEDVFLSSIDWIQKWPSRVVNMGITHVILP